MRVSSESGDFLEIEHAAADRDAHDFLLLVRLQFHGFLATIDTWVQRAAW